MTFYNLRIHGLLFFSYLLHAPVVPGVARPLANGSGRHDGRGAGGAAHLVALLVIQGVPSGKADGVPNGGRNVLKRDFQLVLLSL